MKWAVDNGAAIFGLFDTMNEALNWATFRYPQGGWRIVHFYKVHR